MTVIFHVRTGRLARAGSFDGPAYSGHGDGVNNPTMEADAGIGPIPAGRYLIGPAYDHPHLGPLVCNLTPVGHDAHGRTGFRLHGDNGLGNRSASHGCIVAAHDLRAARLASGDNDLLVVA